MAFGAWVVIPRQGWERYEPPAVPMVFRPAEATSRKPHARAGAGAHAARPRKTTASAKANMSGQPGGCDVRKRARQGRSAVPKTGTWPRRGAEGAGELPKASRAGIRPPAGPRT